MDNALPAYAVPDVKPAGGTSGLRSVQYDCEQLAAFPAVAAALDRTPLVLLAVSLDADERDRFAAVRADLCAELWVGTGDGLNWELTFGDGVNFIIDISSRFGPEDLLEQAIAAWPDVESVFHYDREVFHVRMDRLHRADEMAGRWLDAIVTAHRETARRRGIQLPY
jgi:hypothetical protein